MITAPVIKCKICLICIGPDYIEQRAYPSPRGLVCGKCAESHPVRIDTREKGWRKGFMKW